MNSILMSLSLGLNLMFIAMITTILTKVPFNLDKIRSDYLADMRMFYQRGCELGINEYPRDAEPVVGFNTNSPMNWCSSQADGMGGMFMERLYSVGK